MPEPYDSLHHRLIRNALQKGIRAGTVLQDAVQRVRQSRRQGEAAFNIALGELFVLASDAFKQRNGLQIENKKLKTQLEKKELELQHWKRKSEDLV